MVRWLIVVVGFSICLGLAWSLAFGEPFVLTWEEAADCIIEAGQKADERQEVEPGWYQKAEDEAWGDCVMRMSITRQFKTQTGGPHSGR